MIILNELQKNAIYKLAFQIHGQKRHTEFFSNPMSTKYKKTFCVDFMSYFVSLN